eukprot:TRINITY_DN60093_c0_g1_i1.p1 TRINITY_DN60093_c0_g1~~TRINITY_DN60093_c0_g1_i1.p1  ORF type:complete len:609 (+),score=138.12 TRINITY_DN60093_c0_g1_i1:63-1829(+)
MALRAVGLVVCLSAAGATALGNATGPPEGVAGDCGSDSSSGSGTDECCAKHHSSCDEVQRNCPLGVGGTALFNYYHMHYCVLSDFPWVSMIILIAWLAVIFWLLASTADNFFVVQLDTLSTELHLPPAAAGVTLLALGNSAPDVFSDLAAVQNNDDFALALGELMGASMFLTTIVLGAVVLVATRDGGVCRVDPAPFVRDVSVFFVALLAVLFFSITKGSVSLAESFVVLAIYAVYVAVVVLVSRAQERKEALLLPTDHDPEEVPTSSRSSSQWERARSPVSSRASRVVALLKADSATSVPQSERDAGPACVGLDWEPEAGLLGGALFAVQYPFSVMRWLSIPSADGEWDRRRRTLCAIAPVGAVCVVFLDFSGNWQDGSPADGFRQTVGSSSFPFVGIPLIAAALLGLVVWVSSNDEALPRWHLFLVVVAFASTIAWLDLIGNECVAVIEVLGTITGITATDAGHSILGVTVLAWANSIGDLVADTAIARAGLAHMGVAGVFGAPLLTCCLGLGLATVVAAGSDASHSVDSKLNPEIVTSYAFLACSLLGSMAVIVASKFRVPRHYAYFLFCLYAAYMAASVTVVLS